jgi:DNA-binding NarL/FixJ family response regulator
MVSRARVVVAAERPSKAHELSAILQPEFDIVATVDDGAALLRAASLLRAEVIVTYCESPVFRDISLSELVSLTPLAKVVLVTATDDRATTRASLAAGAAACVLKSNADDELPFAIRAARRGDFYVSASLRQWCLAAEVIL